MKERGSTAPRNVWSATFTKGDPGETLVPLYLFSCTYRLSVTCWLSTNSSLSLSLWELPLLENRVMRTPWVVSNACACILLLIWRVVPVRLLLQKSRHGMGGVHVSSSSYDMWYQLGSLYRNCDRNHDIWEACMYPPPHVACMYPPPHMTYMCPPHTPIPRAMTQMCC